jgi:4-oxalocrotonate tautomerase
MPIVQIDLFPRGLEVKRKLAAELTNTIVDICECPPDAVTIIFRDLLKENYSESGQLRCDKVK